MNVEGDRTDAENRKQVASHEDSLAITIPVYFLARPILSGVVNIRGGRGALNTVYGRRYITSRI